MAKETIEQSIQQLIDNFKKSLEQEFWNAFSGKTLGKDLKFVQADVAAIKKDFFDSINKDIKRLQKDNYLKNANLVNMLFEENRQSYLNEINKLSEQFKAALEAHNTKIQEHQKETDAQIQTVEEVFGDLDALTIDATNRNTIRIRESLETLENSKETVISERFKTPSITSPGINENNDKLTEIKASLDNVREEIANFNERKAPEIRQVGSPKPSVIVDDDKQKEHQLDEDSESYQNEAKDTFVDAKNEESDSKNLTEEIIGDIGSVGSESKDLLSEDGIWSWILDVGKTVLVQSSVVFAAGLMKVYDMFVSDDKKDEDNVKDVDKENEKESQKQDEEINKEIDSLINKETVPSQEDEDGEKIISSEDENDEIPSVEDIKLSEVPDEDTEDSVPSSSGEAPKTPGRNPLPNKTQSDGKDLTTLAEEESKKIDGVVSDIDKPSEDTKPPDLNINENDNQQPTKPEEKQKETVVVSEEAKSTEIPEPQLVPVKIETESSKLEVPEPKLIPIPTLKKNEIKSEQFTTTEINENIKNLNKEQKTKDELTLTTINKSQENSAKRISEVNDVKNNKAINVANQEASLIKAQEDKKKYEEMKAQSLKRQSKEVIINTSNYNMNQFDNMITLLTDTIKQTSDTFSDEYIQEERIPTQRNS